MAMPIAPLSGVAVGDALIVDGVDAILFSDPSQPRSQALAKQARLGRVDRPPTDVDAMPFDEILSRLV